MFQGWARRTPNPSGLVRFQQAVPYFVGIFGEPLL